jgi:urease accessory protein
MQTEAISTAGLGRLDFEKSGERTVARSLYASSPLRLLHPRNAGRFAWIYASSLGGGIVGGDRLRIEARLGEGAEAVLLTQSATKVYRNARASAQSMEVRAGKGSFAVLMPDPTVCFEGSRFEQRQTIDLDEGASLLLADTFHCGRLASGERWKFGAFGNRIEIRREGKPIFLESVRLDAEAGAVAERVGRFNAFCLLVLLGPRVAEPARALLDAALSQKLAPRAELVHAASGLGADGAVLRWAGVAPEDVAAALRHALGFVPELLGDDPWARKW